MRFLFFSSVLGHLLGDRWNASFMLAWASLRGYWSRGLDGDLTIGFRAIFSHLCYWDSLKFSSYSLGSDESS